MVIGSLQLSAVAPAYPLSLSQSSLVALLTVGEVGPLGSGNCDCNRGLHTIAGPANILACVSWRCLEYVEAGAADLGSMGRCVRGVSRSPADAPLFPHSSGLGTASPSAQEPGSAQPTVYGSAWLASCCLSDNVYLVPGREAATTLVPRDLGMGLPCHHTAQIHGLTLSHCGR